MTDIVSDSKNVSKRRRTARFDKKDKQQENEKENIDIEESILITEKESPNRTRKSMKRSLTFNKDSSKKQNMKISINSTEKDSNKRKLTRSSTFDKSSPQENGFPSETSSPNLKSLTRSSTFDKGSPIKKTSKNEDGLNKSKLTRSSTFHKDSINMSSEKELPKENTKNEESRRSTFAIDSNKETLLTKLTSNQISPDVEEESPKMRLSIFKKSNSRNKTPKKDVSFTTKVSCSLVLIILLNRIECSTFISCVAKTIV